MKYVYCKRGQRALVDDEDYARVSQYKWYYSAGYAITTAHHRTIYMHRLVLNAPKGKVIDHLNHDKLDNRKQNLRLCTQRENNLNARRPNNRIGFIGVHQHTSKRWIASTSVGNRTVYLGIFDTPEQAAKARDDFLSERGETIFVKSKM